MGLFGKSMEEKVNDALEKIRGQFPQSHVSAMVDDKTVTLQGRTPDMATKTAIMAAFNDLVKTDNTINRISVDTAEAQTGRGGPAPAQSTAVPGATPGQRTHEVVSGDTLSAISKKYYGNAGDYMKIFNANRDILNDPDKIRPGQKLKIPG